MKKMSEASRKATRRKAMGVHYTPPELARFLADRLVRHLKPASDNVLRILDPACGEGVLLEALGDSLKDAGARRWEVFGVEADADALARAECRLGRFPQARLELLPGDFLDLFAGNDAQAELWDACPAVPSFEQTFDLVIANPPYVRTQVLGADRAQRLAARFGLSGRVDLYHAFLVAATQTLLTGGLMGIITSNRFLTTLGGAALRKYLSRHYEIVEVIDLGDTKLFAAAVLPAIFIGRRRDAATLTPRRRVVSFMNVYSAAGVHSGTDPVVSAPSILEALRHGKAGCYHVPEGVFRLTQGDCVLSPDPAEVWSLTTPEEAEWLRRLRAAANGCFGEIATIRVGIKTTADEVFIRSNWDALPTEVRPEQNLLRPLLRHADARRWVLPGTAEPSAQILYPHEAGDGCRRAVALNHYPRAKAYLETHRARLEKRNYVLEAGRQWYEIWVPQDPQAWSGPKIVFPDISPEPRFFIDLAGHLVDGNCYWMTLRPGIPSDALYLLLAVANSGLMRRFHDLAFNNRLYSGRRRYITQYVAKYPYPPLRSPAARKLVSLVRHILEDRRGLSTEPSPGDVDLQVDSLVQEAFGLGPVETIR